MATPLVTSRIWQVWQGVYEMLRDAAWPVLPDPIEVFLGDDGGRGARNVVVVYVGRESTQGWATLGQRAKDDEFDIVIDFRALAPGGTSQEAKDNLQLISDRIETELRTNFQGPNATALDGVVWLMVQSVNPDVVIYEEGWVGFGQIVVRAKCRI